MVESNAGPTLLFPTLSEEDKPRYARTLEFAPVDTLLQLSKSASHWGYNGQLVPDSSKLHIIPRMYDKISI